MGLSQNRLLTQSDTNENETVITAGVFLRFFFGYCNFASAQFLCQVRHVLLPFFLLELWPKAYCICISTLSFSAYAGGKSGSRFFLISSRVVTVRKFSRWLIDV